MLWHGLLKWVWTNDRFCIVLKIILNAVSKPMQEGTIKSLQKATRLRVLLELEAVAAVGNSPDRLPAARDRLTPLIAEFRVFTTSRDYAAFNQVDYRLHHTLVELAQDPLLLQLWEIAWEAQAALHRDQIASLWPDLRVVANEHVHLIQTICSGDVVATTEALRSHLEALLFRVLETQPAPPEGDTLERVCAWLSCNLHQTIRLHKVAQKVAYTSPGHLSRLFRQRYGVSFNAFVRQLRMDKAVHLLKESQLTIQQIARRCGYPSAARFSEQFKKLHAMSPRTYRKNRTCTLAARRT